MKMSSPTALITGAGSGIGRTIAVSLAEQGYAVVLNDLDAIRADATAYEIAASGGKALAIIGDAGSLEVIEEMKSAALQRFGRIDVAIANTSLTTPEDFFELGETRFQQMIDRNLKGPFFLAQSIARHFREQEEGRLLFLTSPLSATPQPKDAAYAMTTAALHMLAKSLAPELTPHHVTVNCLVSGSALASKALSERLAFLLSKEAEHITGQILTAGQVGK